jgi:hypothetical protein
MAKNFLDQEERGEGVSYTDGFRFGFGFFIANLLGLTILGLLVVLVNLGMQRLH